MGAEIKDRWVQVGDLKIHYLEAGASGLPLLLLHGGGLDSASLSWRPAMEALAVKHHVIAPDLPGYGESDAPCIQYTMQYYVDCVDRLMEAMGLERAVVGGLSLGGGIALGVALRRPERVEKLVLVDAAGLGSRVPFGVLGWALVHLPRLNAMSWASLAGDRNAVRQALQRIVKEASVVSDELVDEVFELVRKPGAGAAWRSLQRHETRWLHLRTSYVERLPEVKMHTLILHGEDDTLVPLAWSERAEQLIPNAELHVVPGVAHWLPREKPEEFVRHVLEFLA